MMRFISFFLLAESSMSLVSSPQPRFISSSDAAAGALFATTRREILQTGGLSVLASVLLSSSSAMADVADGNELPDGVAQFARLLKVKSDIVGVKQRLASNPADIDKKEWTNIGGFLRRIYAEADDIKSVANSQAPEKKKEALEIAELLRKYSKGGESSINAQDAKALTAVLDKCSSLFQDFFDLLSDVPDEI